MKCYEVQTVETRVCTTIQCDRCKRIDEVVNNEFGFGEPAEYLQIDFTGGYFNSTFGDMTGVEADLCQYCVHELLKEFARTKDWLAAPSTIFTVMQDGRSCTAQEWDLQSEGWDQNEFSSFTEAVNYAHKWLGVWSPGVDTLKTELETRDKYTFSMGHIITIEEY